MSSASHKAFKRLSPSNLKINYVPLQPKLPDVARDLTEKHTHDFDTFFCSDHAKFWYPHNRYHKTFASVFVTDVGPFRGELRGCYHQPCDNDRLLTNDNMEYMARTIEVVMADMVLSKYKSIKLNSKRKVLMFCLFLK